MQCPNCRAEVHKLIWTRPLTTHIARGYTCKGCGITFETAERPTEWLLPAMVPPESTPVVEPKAERSLDDALNELTNEDFQTDE